MPADNIRTPLTTWSRDLVRATVVAYRRAKGEGATEAESHAAGRAAYIAAGGDPAAAPRVCMEMVAAAAREHSEWFWRPLQHYMDRRDRYMRSIRMWPPPLNWNAWPKPPEDFA